MATGMPPLCKVCGLRSSELKRKKKNGIGIYGHKCAICKESSAKNKAYLARLVEIPPEINQQFKNVRTPRRKLKNT